jgi:3-phenylpropionate/trans-cinnamate dioxygenase ferredoxin reductase subunit
MRVVIVGAGLAGLRTAEALRDKGFEGEIVLIGEELHLPYDRPPLSKHVLRGERGAMYLRPEEEYADLDLDLRLGTAVTAVDLGTRTVAGVTFDHLVIATGATPRRLPGSPGHVLRTLDDCQGLAAVLVGGASIAIIGAGLIGCEVAASARKLEVDVHLIDLLPKPLVRVLGATVAQKIADLHVEHGVHLHLGTGVAEATDTCVQLADGTVLEVDAVLEAMGVVPCTDWLSGSGLAVDDGVLCDEYGHAAEGVWAVGDVARWSDGRGGSFRREHWTSAAEQAAAVAGGILGEQQPVTAAPYWWSDQYDLKLQGLGEARADDDVQVVTVGPRSKELALYSRSGLLTGVVGFSAGAFVFKLRDHVSRNAPLAEVLAFLDA